jgi:hypothetical protein
LIIVLIIWGSVALKNLPIDAVTDISTPSFGTEDIRIISTDKDRTAIEFLNQKRSMNDKLVISGAYEIMSAILIQGEEK